MRTFRSSRWLALVLFAILLPASSFAGVFISVGFAPPPLPVYDQPPCPDEGLMWMPGYWAYGPDGYYWVPGAWVPAPYDGALWTPPYWGWDGGLYIFHPGYWGPHVGYYGGVNYGFGYMGIGFVGGMWRGHDFVYNTAIVHVDERRIHYTYQDRAAVDRDTVARGSRVAFSGGPGGIHHSPDRDELAAEHDRHAQPTRFQQQHVQAAQSDRNSYARNNGGRPKQIVSARPLPAEHVTPPQTNQRNSGSNNNNSSRRPDFNNTVPRTNPGSSEARPVPPTRQNPQSRPAPQFHTEPQSRPVPRFHPAPQQRSAPPRVEQQSRPAPQMRSAPPPRPAPAPRPAPQQHNEPRGDEHGHGR